MLTPDQCCEIVVLGMNVLVLVTFALSIILDDWLSRQP